MDHEWSNTSRRAVSPTTHTTWRGGTLRPILKPVACWRIQHAYFQFDSSVILPQIAAELLSLKSLIREDRVATIFGHADQVGNEEYNAHLSARRARALYGLLTRNAEIWLELFAPKDYDKWGLTSSQAMLAALTAKDGSRYYTGTVNGAYEALTDSAIRKFQGDEELSVDGLAGPVTRKRLYERYIDLLTGSPSVPLMRPDQFLGDPVDNAHPKGKAKAAFQGCGEYNPVLILSSADENAYAQQQDKTDRSEANAPNRRAMIFFFAKNRLGAKLPADIKAIWPCPAWDEGASGCRAQFWPDSKQRLANGDRERHYAEDHHTMACSWYDRWARLSPCEGRVAIKGSSLTVRPPIYIDGTPDDANLVLFISLPSADSEVVSLRIAGQALVADEHYFQYGASLFFATVNTGADCLDGEVVLTGPPMTAYSFQLLRAKTLAERADSLSIQVENSIQLAREAAKRSVADGKSGEEGTALRAELLNIAFHRHIQLIETLESTLTTDEDHTYLEQRRQGLPTLFMHAEEK